MKYTQSISIPCFIFVGLLIFCWTTWTEAKLIDILANELNFDLQVKELEVLKKEAQFNYSDEYANYKLDMKELEKQRNKLLEALRSEESRKEMEEKGMAIQFQLKFYANLTSSLINIQQRIHHLLALKDLRMDVLNRLPVMVQQKNAFKEKLIKEDQVKNKKIVKEMEELKKEVKQITKGKNPKELSPDQMEKLKILHEKYRDLVMDKRQVEAAIARFQREVTQSRKLAKNLDRIKPHLDSAFKKLERQRERLHRQVINLKRDVNGLDISVSTDELIRKVSAVWGEVTDISTDLGKFAEDYAELEKFQEFIHTARVKREDITLESVLSEGQEMATSGRSTEKEILNWIKSLK